MMDTIRAVLVPVNAECREVELPVDENGSCDAALKGIVGERAVNVSKSCPTSLWEMRSASMSMLKRGRLVLPTVQSGPPRRWRTRIVSPLSPARP